MLNNFRGARPATLSLVIAVATVGLAGCGPRTLDGSDADTLADSYESIEQNLSAEERRELEEAMTTIALSTVDIDAVFSGVPSNPQAAVAREVDGMTVDQILQRAHEIEGRLERERQVRRAEQEQREAEQREERIAQAEQELSELENELQEIESERVAELERNAIAEQFNVISSRFRFQEQRFGGPDPVLEIEMENNSEFAISRIFFNGVLATPGRSVPWIEDTFNYSISGGLEPGEVLDVSLAPSSISDWGSAPQDRDDMVFTVTPYRADDPQGEPIFDTNRPPESEQRKENVIRRIDQLTNILEGFWSEQ